MSNFDIINLAYLGAAGTVAAAGSLAISFGSHIMFKLSLGGAQAAREKIAQMEDGTAKTALKAVKATSLAIASLAATIEAGSSLASLALMAAGIAAIGALSIPSGGIIIPLAIAGLGIGTAISIYVIIHNFKELKNEIYA